MQRRADCKWKAPLGLQAARGITSSNAESLTPPRDILGCARQHLSKTLMSIHKARQAGQHGDGASISGAASDSESASLGRCNDPNARELDPSEPLSASLGKGEIPQLGYCQPTSLDARTIRRHSRGCGCSCGLRAVLRAVYPMVHIATWLGSRGIARRHVASTEACHAGRWRCMSTAKRFAGAFVLFGTDLGAETGRGKKSEGAAWFGSI